MNPYFGEQEAYERLEEIRHEMELSRLIADGGRQGFFHMIQFLSKRLWWIAGLAGRRAPRWHLNGRANRQKSSI